MGAYLLPAAILALLVIACGGQSVANAAAQVSGREHLVEPSAATPVVEPLRLHLEVIAKYPHPSDAYTQGLVWHQGQLLESCGNYGLSQLRRSDPTSGEVLARRKLPRHFFAEGLARVGSRLYQLTWKSGVLLVSDLETLAEVDRLSYRGEGWGLAHDGEKLVMSDGSDLLSFRDVDDFTLLSQLPVTLQGRPQNQLNELEYVDGRLYANLWYRDEIVEIDPISGAITAVIDASGLLTAAELRHAEVLNGIAWDPSSESFWITGKHWPWMFQVRFVE